MPDAKREKSQHGYTPTVVDLSLALTRRCAHPMFMGCALRAQRDACSGELRQRLLHPLRRERQRAQALPRGVEEGIGDRRCGRTLRAFAHAEETLFGAIEQHHLDLWHVPEMN